MPTSPDPDRCPDHCSGKHCCQWRLHNAGAYMSIVIRYSEFKPSHTSKATTTLTITLVSPAISLILRSLFSRRQDDMCRWKRSTLVEHSHCAGTSLTNFGNGVRGCCNKEASVSRHHPAGEAWQVAQDRHYCCWGRNGDVQTLCPEKCSGTTEMSATRRFFVP